NLLSLGHGTTVHMQLLRKPPRGFQNGAVSNELSSIYAPGLRSGRRITWRSMRGGKIVREDVLAPPEPPSAVQMEVAFDEDVPVYDRSLRVSGRISLSEKLPISSSVISIGFNHREFETTRD